MIHIFCVDFVASCELLNNESESLIRNTKLLELLELIALYTVCFTSTCFPKHVLVRVRGRRGVRAIIKINTRCPKAAFVLYLLPSQSRVK